MRWIFILLLLTMMILLSFYGARHHPWIHIKDCLQDPVQYDGKLVTDFSEPMIGEIYADGFTLLQKQVPPIRIYSDTTGLIQGEYVGLRGIFHKEGYITASIVGIAKNRKEKIWISVLPVFFVGILFIRQYRFNINKCQIELKEHA